MRICWAFLLLFNVCAVASQTLTTETTDFHLDALKYRFAPISGHRGLDLTNSDIVSDDKGFLWIGTQDGLIRLDAYESKRFVKSTKNSNSIAGNFVTKVAYQASQQSLWIGTATGLSRYHLPSETFRNFVSDEKDGSLDNDYIQSIFIDQQDNVWIGTQNGLYRFDSNSESFTKISLNASTEVADKPVSIMDIKQSDSGELWIASQEGIFILLDDAVASFFQPINKDANSRHVITSLLFQSPDKVWIGTEQNGLLLYNTVNKQLVTFTQENTAGRLPSNYIRALLLPKNGKEIWIGTDGGLSIYQIDQRTFLPIFNNESISEGIVAFYEDRNESIWVGTWSKGLHQYDPNQTQIGTLSRKLLSGSGENLRRIIKGKDDDIWFSNYRTLFQLKTQKNQLTKYDILPINLTKNRSIPIWNANDTTLYLLTKDIYRIRSSADVDKIGIPEEIRNLSWYDATFDTKGQLWLRSRTAGIFCMDPSLSKVIHRMQTSIAGFAEQIDESTMVFGTQQSSYFVDINTFETTQHNPSNANGMRNANITGFYRDAKDRTWVGTSGGIHELLTDFKSPEYRAWTTDNGLPTDVLTGPINDNYSKLWFSSTDGLIRFDPTNESFTQYDTDAGALSNYSIGQFTKDLKQRMYFLGPAGISIIDQSTINANRIPNRLIINDVLIRSTGLRQESVDKLLPPAQDTDAAIVAHRQSIALPAEYRDFTVEFTTPYMSQPEDAVFFYRLVGFNESWSETGATNRRATYTNLEPGNYTFEVYSTSAYGIASEPTHLNIVLKPYFYETLLFKTLVVLLFISLIIGWYRYRVYKIKEYNLLLEKQVEQRTRDINTLADIGRDITSILEIEDLSENLYNHLNRSLKVSVVGIGTYEPIEQRIKFERTYEDGEPLPSFYKTMDTTSELAAWCIQHGKEVILSRYTDRSRYLTIKEKDRVGKKMQSIVYIPVISRNETKLGCITIQSSKVNAFSAEDIEFIRTIANYTSIALDNVIAHNELKKASYTDYLTDLPNRRAFLEKARYQIRIDDRSGQPLAFAIADIDHFKDFNDTYGHDSGDLVLQRTAKVFDETLRSQDMTARWGGEEFVFMLPNTNAQGATVALDKIRQRLSKETFDLKGESINVTATFGVVEYSPGLTIEELIDLADSALYEGKHAGRNQIKIAEKESAKS
ncbi:diguanylate cyclase [Aliikangiella marina]|uniref:diguanylate cyclase n=1 Tax=Aliikangiella marina TaxID=1712262 RepID=A0A545TGZ4_9GAMM|nr:diguanylate cyclase [Aliikangiella marina]TQV76466.1 diguanylate cyclase [Aliikangiella marina]